MTIQDNIDTIRGAVKGKDVREAIAQLGEAIRDIPDVSGSLDDLNTAVTNANNIIATIGTTAQNAADNAATTAATNAVKNVTGQLQAAQADANQTIVDLDNANKQVNKQLIDAQSIIKSNENTLAQVREQSENIQSIAAYNQDQIDKGTVATQDQINSISSSLEEKANKSDIGSPLTASSIAEMTDTTKVYVNTTDGNWYSYNGTSWVIGGVYQSNGIGDGSITATKTNFAVECKNLLDLSLLEEGYKYTHNSSTNTISKTEEASRGCFPKIKLQANTTYSVSTGYSANFSFLTDADGTVLNKLGDIISNNKFTPTQECYLSLSIDTTIDYSEIMLVPGDLPSEYKTYNVPYKVTIKGLDISDNDEISNISNKVNDVETTVNNIDVDNIIYNQLADATDKRKNYNSIKSIYRVRIKNPLELVNVAYGETPVQIYISFNQGECKNERCIEITNSTGNIILFQWEENETKNPNYIFSNGRYYDGSLRDGSLWIMIDSLSATEEKLYTITVYETELSNTYTDKITFASGTNDSFTLDNTVITFEASSSYLPSSIKINGTSCGKFDTRIADNTYSYGANTAYKTTIIDKYVLGEGVIFKDYVCKFKLTYNENIIFTTKTRLFTNGEIRIYSEVETLSNLDAGVLNGVLFRLWNYSDTVYINSNKNAIYSSVLGSVMHDVQIEPNGAINTLKGKYNTYSTWVLNNPTSSTDKRIESGWSLTSGDTLAVNKGDSWSCCAIFKVTTTTSTTNATNTTNLLMNPLIFRATNVSNYNNKNKLKEMLKDYITRGHNSTLSDTFRGCEVIELITYQEITGEDIQSTIDTKYEDMMTTYYGGLTGTGFWDAFKGGRGIEYIGRDTVCMKYLRDIYVKNNTTDKLTNITTAMHNLADFYIQVEYMSGNSQYNGNINLGYSTTYANPNGVNVPNAQGAALRDLKNSLDIEENTDRRDCYNRVRSKFLESNQFYNISPHVKDTLVYRFPEWHYEFFAGYDYANNCEKEYSVIQRVYEGTDASGEFNEIRGNYYSDKRGLSHAYLYAIGILLNNNQSGDLEQSIKIMEVLLRDTYTDNYRKLWIDGWNNNTEINKKDQIALGVASEILLEYF